MTSDSPQVRLTLDYPTLRLKLTKISLLALAYSALEKELTDVLKNSTGNSWLSATFSQTYNSQALNENSLRTISVLFYTNAELSDGPFSMKAKFISYLGVSVNAFLPESYLIVSLGILSRTIARRESGYHPPYEIVR